MELDPPGQLEPAAHPGEEIYYLTARDDARVAYLVGPMATREEAQTFEDPARQIISDQYPLDMNAIFAGVGVTRAVVRPGRRGPVGKFNDQLGLIPPTGAGRVWAAPPVPAVQP